jgi:hypothetical protein
LSQIQDEENELEQVEQELNEMGKGKNTPKEIAANGGEAPG